MGISRRCGDVAGQDGDEEIAEDRGSAGMPVLGGLVLRGRRSTGKDEGIDLGGRASWISKSSFLRYDGKWLGEESSAARGNR